jgi:hypothetical protein
MFDSVVLEVVIGLVFVYFIISLLCSTLTEWIARMTALRAKTLKDGINTLLQNDDALKKIIFDHPLVAGISPKNKNWWEFFNRDKPFPSNVPSRTFSTILLETIKEKTEAPEQSTATQESIIKQLENGINIWDNAKTKQVLNALLYSSKTQVNKEENVATKFQVSIEKWFDDAMDRVSGWYKRKSQLIVLILAIILCGAFNIDTYMVATSLFQDTTLRTSIVAAAEARVKQSVTEDTNSEANISELRDELSELKLPIGWSGDPDSPKKTPGTFIEVIIKLAGILFTAFAVTLGASFWFDLLSKIVNLRSSGKKPEKAEQTETK